MQIHQWTKNVYLFVGCEKWGGARVKKLSHSSGLTSNVWPTPTPPHATTHKPATLHKYTLMGELKILKKNSSRVTGSERTMDFNSFMNLFWQRENLETISWSIRDKRPLTTINTHALWYALLHTLCHKHCMFLFALFIWWILYSEAMTFNESKNQ